MADILGTVQSLLGFKATTSSGGVQGYATAASSAASSFATSIFSSAPPPGRPYTAWYRVWERVELADFKLEAFLLPVAILIMVQLVWGRGANRRKANNWMSAHSPILMKEFASVGFSGKDISAWTAETMGPVKSELLLKEKTATEFVSYATGRQNVAFLDIKINLLRRFNPIILLSEYIASILVNSVKPPKENIELVAYTFDGHEKDLVTAPASSDEAQKLKVNASGHDGFVWAVVHKDTMKAFRNDRFDVSLTDVKDNAKLPNWATVMSESAEITDALLTPELIKAIETAGDDLFENLLITDMPADKPKSLDELEPRKRLSLTLNLPPGGSVQSYDRTLPIFSHFVRLPDELVSKAHFRSEVQKRLRSTREDETKRVRRAAEEEKAEERKLEADKRKKQEREELLRTMSPAEQRKYLDKEREKQNRKNMRKMRA